MKMKQHQQHALPVITAICRLFRLILHCQTITVFAVATNDIVIAPTISIEGRLQYPNKLPYNNITTSIIVNHGEYNTYSRLDGTFTIYNITPGVHIIDIYNPIHHFSQIKCLYKPTTDDKDDDDNSIQTTTIKKPELSCLEYYYPGASKRTIDMDASNILTITALASYEYFEVKRGFNLLSMLQNPMILMMIFTGGIMYLLPKMMENMDPEERAMMQKQMSQQQNPQQLMSQLFSGNLNIDPTTNVNEKDSGRHAITSSSSPSSSASPQPTLQPKPSSSSNNNQKHKKHRK
jgi:ER membrane protein complex subunit 7